MDSEIDWRLSFPYQVAFQKVRTKLTDTVRFVPSSHPHTPPELETLHFCATALVLLNSSFLHQYVLVAFFRADAFPIRT